MSETDNQQLVEHFFRHESANLISVLTRAFGVRNIELIEDSVQSALVAAMNAWKLTGPPQNPAGWIHRVARNRVLDRLRRDKIHERALAFAKLSSVHTDSLVDQWLQEDQLPDSLLRMMFVCCHPALPRSSQIALTLKVLCGLGIQEISRALLVPAETIKKRIQRARQRLAEQQITVDTPPDSELEQRLDVVHDVLYLTFNEGYSTSHGREPIRDDLCEEAARLCYLLCNHDQFSSPTNRALLALMLFHGARLESRIDGSGAPILLEDQDRKRWDQSLIHVAQSWLTRSQDERVSRFHFEAAIAGEHCRATSFDSTNWSLIVRYYDALIEKYPSPIYGLNRAIARGQMGDITTARRELNQIADREDLAQYFLVDCAQAQLFELEQDSAAAIECYLRALSQTVAPHEKKLLQRKIRDLS